MISSMDIKSYRVTALEVHGEDSRVDLIEWTNGDGCDVFVTNNCGAQWYLALSDDEADIVMNLLAFRKQMRQAQKETEAQDGGDAAKEDPDEDWVEEEDDEEDDFPATHQEAEAFTGGSPGSVWVPCRFCKNPKCPGGYWITKDPAAGAPGEGPAEAS